MTDKTSIKITVDASQGLAGLAALRQSIGATSRELQSLGSGNASSFSGLARGLSSVGSGFDSLKRATSGGSGLSNLSREISLLSRGMPTLAKEFVALASTALVSKNAILLFGSALASAGVSEFARSIAGVGNSLISFKIGIDSVAASSQETSRAFDFVRKMATDIGAPLDSTVDSFKQLYVNMRALGRPVPEIESVFKGFQTALTSLHVSPMDVRTFWRETAETFSQGAIHARQGLLSAGSHIPGMAALWQQALGVNGEGLKHLFHTGGLPLEAWTKAAAILEQRFGQQLPEAAKHSQMALNALGNEWTKLQQSAFDNGFDSGLTKLAQTIRGVVDSFGGADAIGAKIGTMFRGLFTGASLLLEKLVSLREPITTIGTLWLTWSISTSIVTTLAGAIALLVTPLGAAIAGTVLLITQWESLKSVFSGSDKAFNDGAEAIKRLTGGWLDLHKAILGAVEVYELAKGLIGGKGWSESLKLSSEAGGAFLRGTYGQKAGESFADAYVTGVGTLFGKIDALFSGKTPGKNLVTSIRDEWQRIYKSTENHPFVGSGSYDENSRRYATVDRSLSEELKKVYERLLPTNKALSEYRDTLDQIAKMRGKIDPFSGKAIGDEQIRRMTAAARADAFESSFPMAAKIQEKLAELQAASDMLGSKSGKTSFDAEREVLREVNALKRKGVEIRDDEVDALRKIVTLEKELQKGGSDALSQWAHNQKSQIESMNDAIKGGLDSFADGVAKIATEGKGKFKSLGEAIRSEMSDILRGIARNMISSSIKSLMADGIKSLDIGGMKGKLTEALGLGQGVVDKANSALDKLSSVATANMEVQAAVVNINGLNASGLDAFKPGSTLQDSINPKAVGGVEKTASESLFAGNALASREQSITNNSVQAFAQVLARTKGVASESITRDSVSEFGRIINLQKTQPLAEQLAVKPLADSSVNLLSSAPRISTRAGTDMVHVNDKLKDILDNASKQLPDGWRAQYISGYRHTGAVNPNSRHDRGLAADVQLFDEKGKSLPNYQSPETFRAYESYAQAARRYQTKTYPELNDKFAWGGYFSHGGKPFGYGAADQMHFDLGGHQGIMGDWQHGLTRGRGIYDTPSKPSVGMGAGLSEGRSAFTGNSLKPLSDSTQKVAKDFERNMKVASDKFAPEFAKDLNNAAKNSNTGNNGGGSGDIGKATDNATTNINQQSSDATGSLTQLGGSIANLATNSKNAPSAIAGVAQSIMNLISQLSSGAGGGGGGAGGLIGGAVSLLGGLFEEGGVSGSAVTSAAMPASYWAGAPAYAEGTPNTSGGMPAILHDNEAVIPLSRGREIPVDLKGAGGGGDTTVNYHMHSNISAKDHDSFRRNSNQMAADFHKMAARMHVRNN